MTLPREVVAPAMGDLVMTGSMTRVFQLAPGDHLRAEFDGIGAVTMSAAP